MKNKVLTIVQLVLMYLSCACLWIIYFIGKATEEEVVVGALTLGISAFSLIAFVFAIINAIKTGLKPDECVFKRSIVSKCLIYAWDVACFFAIYCLASLSNVILIIVFFPLLIIILIGYAILFLILSSVPVVISSVKYLKQNMFKNSGLVSSCAVMSFIPVLDVVAAIILTANFKKNLIKESVEND